MSGKMCRDSELFAQEVDENLLCPIGQGVLQDPVRLPCGHVFCFECIDQYLSQRALQNKTGECPLDRKPVDKKMLQKDFLLSNLVGNLKTQCDNKRGGDGCPWVGKLNELSSHKDKDCQYEAVSCPFASHGCEAYQIERRLLEQHSKESVHTHLGFICKKLVAQEDLIKTQASRVTQLRDTLDKLSTTQRQQKELVDALMTSAEKLSMGEDGIPPNPLSIITSVPAPPLQPPMPSHQQLFLVSNGEDPSIATYRWKISNFSKQRKKEIQSEDFSIGSLPWYLRCSAPEDFLQMYLRVPHVIVSFPRSWKVYTQISFGCINQLNEKKSVWRYTSHTFDHTSVSWGYQNFITMQELLNDGGFVVDDTLILETTVKVFADEAQSQQAASLQQMQQGARDGGVAASAR